MWYKLLLRCVGMVFVVLVLCRPVLAHDATVNETLEDMDGIIITHIDEDPWAGWVDVTMTNSSETDWGDFHFQIMSCMGSNVSNVDILDVQPNKPVTDRNPSTYVVDNVVVGSTLDYYFYGDPVGDEESAWFKFYTNNPDHVNFCICMCPTPVPEPTMLSLLGLGLGTVLLIRRRK